MKGHSVHSEPYMSHLICLSRQPYKLSNGTQTCSIFLNPSTSITYPYQNLRHVVKFGGK